MMLTKERVQVARVIAAPRERVWNAWTQPAHVRHWSAPQGSDVADVSMDVRVGGAYRIVMRAPDGGESIAVGTYREVRRPDRLVYTWQWAKSRMGMPDTETLVQVDFEDVGTGTRVTVTHEGFLNEEIRDGHEAGWSSSLTRFASVAESGL